MAQSASELEEKYECEKFEASDAPAHAETSEERTRRLAADFERSLMQFDRCLQKQQAVASASSSASASASSSAAGGASSSAGTSASSEAEGSNEAAQSESGAGGEEPLGSRPVPVYRDSAEEAPTTVASTNGAIPRDIPDGNDDDIVAQQLRQAAMEAEDAETREKLWDEYRKYKGIER